MNLGVLFKDFNHKINIERFRDNMVVFSDAPQTSFSKHLRDLNKD